MSENHDLTGKLDQEELSKLLKEWYNLPVAERKDHPKLTDLYLYVGNPKENKVYEDHINNCERCQRLVVYIKEELKS